MVDSAALWLIGALHLLAAMLELTCRVIEEGRVRRERTGALLSRPCAGLAWHQAFRSSRVPDIRSFLQAVAPLFGMHARPIHLRPDDRVLTLYRASSPGDFMDLLELEELAFWLEREHGVDTRDVWPDDAWPDDLTLGDLFALTERG